MSDIVALQEGVFYFYSIFMSNISIAQTLLTHAYRYLYFGKIEPWERYLIARIAVTSESQEISDNLGAKAVFGEEAGQETGQTEIAPIMYEHNFATEMQRVGNILPLVEECDGETGDEQ